MKKYYISLLTLFLLFTTSCKKNDTDLNITKSEKYCIPQGLKEELSFKKIENLPITQTLTLTGNIQYNNDKTIPFVSLSDGLVTATYFTLGDYVKKGQLLVEIKSSELNEMSDQRTALKAQIEVAKRQLDATQSMYNDGIVSQKELAEAQSELTVLKSSLTTIQNNMSIYSSNDSKATFQIKAPAEGYIVSKNINAGMSIHAGEDVLFTIADLNEVWIMANVYATYMRHVHPNQTVKVKTLAYPDQYFNGTITSISQVFDEDERVLKAKIVMENKEGKLKPGMSADLILDLDTTQEKALAIPVGAVIFDNNQNYVIVYHNECNQEIRAVKSIAKNDFFVYVQDNFKEGETVLTTNALLIYDELNNRKN